MGFLELAGVDAEVAVCGFEHAFEIVEAEGIVGGEGADDAEAYPLVNQAIELGEFGSRGDVLPRVLMRLFATLSVNFLVDPRLRFGVLAAG